MDEIRPDDLDGQIERLMELPAKEFFHVMRDSWSEGLGIFHYAHPRENYGSMGVASSGDWRFQFPKCGHVAG